MFSHSHLFFLKQDGGSGVAFFLLVSFQTSECSSYWETSTPDQAIHEHHQYFPIYIRITNTMPSSRETHTLRHDCLDLQVALVAAVPLLCPSCTVSCKAPYICHTVYTMLLLSVCIAYPILKSIETNIPHFQRINLRAFRTNFKSEGRAGFDVLVKIQ